jgi:sugar phosphate isomerase/epimerase
VRFDGSIVPAGQGNMDYICYLSLLRQSGYQGPIIAHGHSETETPAVVQFLNALLK